MATLRNMASLSSLPAKLSLHISPETSRQTGSSMSSIQSQSSQHSASSGAYHSEEEEEEEEEERELRDSPSPIPARIDSRRRKGRFSICVPEGTPQLTTRSADEDSEDSGRGSRTPPHLMTESPNASPFESSGDVSPMESHRNNREQRSPPTLRDGQQQSTTKNRDENDPLMCSPSKDDDNDADHNQDHGHANRKDADQSRGSDGGGSGGDDKVFH